MHASLNKYKSLFSNLYVRVVDGKKFPNKPILLLSIIDLIRCKYIKDNQIMLDDTICEAFKYNWKLYIGTEAPTVWTPFWHMKSESFWHFEPLKSKKDIDLLVKTGETASIGKMRSAIKFVWIDKDLWLILNEPELRNELTDILLDCYTLRR
jgi:putative restriction endonuclease